MSYWEELILKVRSGVLRGVDKLLGVPQKVYAFARDVNLAMDDATAYTAGTTTSTVIDTEGGFFATVTMYVSAIATTSDTLDTQIQASIDGGTNYFQIGDFPQIDDTEDGIVVSRAVYVPRPASGQTVTKVRLSHVISAGGSATISSWLDPLLSLGVPAVDEELSQGLAKLT